MLIINIDDDEDAHDLFRYAIRSISPAIACKFFECGPDFLKFVETTDVLPDFIFLDINMPKMTGYDCAAAIRSITKLKNARIVMHSTSFDSTEQTKCANLGLEFLPKPNKLSKLIQDLKDLVL